jgi:hypothetical protein
MQKGHLATFLIMSSEHSLQMPLCLQSMMMQLDSFPKQIVHIESSGCSCRLAELAATCELELFSA